MTLKRQVNIGTLTRVAGYGRWLQCLSVTVLLFLCVAVCSGDQQCKWPSNDTELFLMNWLHLVQFEGGFKH
jgi:hypothetical protein